MFRQLFGNTAWSLAAALVSRIAVFIAHALTIRVLGPEAYGAIALTHTTVLVAAGAIGLGMGTAATRLISCSGMNEQRRLSVELKTLNRWMISLSAMAATIIVFGRRTISESVGSELPGFEISLVVGGTMLIPIACSFYQSGVLVGLGAFREQAVANALGAVVTIVATMFALPHGIIVVLFAIALGHTVVCLLQGRVIRAWHSENGMSDKSDTTFTMPSTKFSLVMPTVAMQATNAPADLFVYAMLARATGGLIEVGIFGAASFWCQLLRFIPTAIAGALLPQISLANACGEDKTVWRLTAVAISSATIVSLTMAVLVVYNTDLILALYGTALSGKGALLSLVAATGVAVALQYTAERALLGASYTALPLVLAITRAVVYCVLAGTSVDLDAEQLAAYRLATYVGHAGLASTLALLLTSRRDRSKSNMRSLSRGEFDNDHAISRAA